MKTIEEKIEDEIIEFEANRDSSEYYDPGYKTGFKTGAYWMKDELTRWRDPKEEMPKDGECVLVKTIYGDLSVAYYWEEKGDFAFWDAPIHDVVGWREIIEL